MSAHWSTAQVTELALLVGENKHNKHVFIPGVVRHQSKQPSTTKQTSLRRITEVVILPETEGITQEPITGVAVVGAEAPIRLLYCR